MELHTSSDAEGGDDPVSDEGNDAGEGQSRLRTLYARYFADLVSHLRWRYGSGPPDPTDIAQATFEKLSQHGMISDVDNLEAYAWTTANNLIRNERRALLVRNAHAQQENSENIGAECDEFDPERVVMAREELKIVLEALKQMPERRRDVFIACRIDGLNPRQAGERLGISRSAAVRHLALATEFLAREVAQYNPEKLK
ncbi:MAG: sigma-70 family RNA polymerase sigma factor [Pseudomonadota bacterium]